MKKFLLMMALSFFVSTSTIMALDMKTFGSIGLGWSSDKLTLELPLGDESFKYGAIETYPYYELSIGEEINFDKYNGIQIYAFGGIFGKIQDNLNLNRGSFGVGANYVLESGEFFNGLQVALLSGFDMRARFSNVYNKDDKTGLMLQTKNSTTPNESITKTSFAMNYNLGLRLRYERYAFSWIIQFPLFSSDTPIEVDAYIPNKISLISGKVTSYPIVSTFNFIFFL